MEVRKPFVIASIMMAPRGRQQEPHYKAGREPYYQAGTLPLARGRTFGAGVRVLTAACHVISKMMAGRRCQGTDHRATPSEIRRIRQLGIEGISSRITIGPHEFIIRQSGIEGFKPHELQLDLTNYKLPNIWVSLDLSSLSSAPSNSPGPSFSDMYVVRGSIAVSNTHSMIPDVIFEFQKWKVSGCRNSLFSNLVLIPVRPQNPVRI